MVSHAISEVVPSVDPPYARSQTDPRIDGIRRQRWLKYDRADSLLANLEWLFEQPRMHRMPHMLVYGPTNNGKSSIAMRFRDRHEPYFSEDGERRIMPVVYLEMPPKPSEGRFYVKVLEALGAECRVTDPVAKNEQRVYHCLKVTETKILIVDEVHNALAGSTDQHRLMLRVLKTLGNLLQLSIVAVGTAEAQLAVSSDPQMANRFVPEPLPQWGFDNEFVAFLKGMIKSFELRKDTDLKAMKDVSLARRIYFESQGYVGEAATILRLAGEAAVVGGAECITHEVLDGIGFVRPALRRDIAQDTR